MQAQCITDSLILLYLCKKLKLLVPVLKGCRVALNYVFALANIDPAANSHISRMINSFFINVSKLGEAYESTAPAVGAIINSSFAEGHFVAAEKRGLIRPYLKKIELDVNICPTTVL